ncbi:MAG: hypothetical protein JWN03_858 [Nocardia sp.]|uniref:hypothetical protein n=1 Tax=Nocardia sp. TaxID=1821 RepID=UPI00262D70EF|nr:hypothetical protein [Nocardia sp.]MCU1640583.1 hypothetical protein [Nocardia sp.]
MTWLVLAVISALAFVIAGGLITALRAYLERRASERAIAAEDARLRAEAERERERLRRDAAEETFRADPVPALTATLAQYVQQVRIPRNAAANAADAIRVDRSQQYVDQLAQLPESLRDSGTTRYAVLAAVPLFGVGSLVAGVLDYMTFRGVNNTVLLPVLLSVLTVLIMTVSSVLIGLGMGWHKGLAGADWTRFRRGVVARAGVVFAVAGLIAMVWIAPKRTATHDSEEITGFENERSYYETLTPPTNETTTRAKDAADALARAKLNMRTDAAVDRVSVGGITFLEIPLTEGMLFGSQVLLCFRARQRRDEAMREHQQTLDAIEQADARMRADMLELLAAHGHGMEPLRLAWIRLQEMNVVWDAVARPRELDAAGAGEPGSDGKGAGPVAENSASAPTPDGRSPAQMLLDAEDEMSTQPRGSEGNP